MNGRPPTRARRALAAAALPCLAVLALLRCYSASPGARYLCESDGTCRSGEVCRQGECWPVADAGASRPDAAAGSDASDVEPDAAVDEDSGLPGETDAGCPNGQKRCKGACIDESSCCENTDCSDGKSCLSGSCACTDSQKECNGKCIALGHCCEDADCTGGRQCGVDSVCRCPGTLFCGGTCGPGTCNASIGTVSPGSTGPAPTTSAAVVLLDDNGGSLRSFSIGPLADGYTSAVSGDWDGDHVDTIGLFINRPGLSGYTYSNTNADGPGTAPAGYGDGGHAYATLAGHWNIGAASTAGIYDPASGYFWLDPDINGFANMSVQIDPALAPLDSQPIAGDWTGQGRDSVGLCRVDPGGAHFYLFHIDSCVARVCKSSLVATFTWTAYVSGTAVAGDWRSTGLDSVGLVVADQSCPTAWRTALAMTLAAASNGPDLAYCLSAISGGGIGSVVTGRWH
jgi:hypothetical protein